MIRNPLDDRSRHDIGRPIQRRISVPFALALCAAATLIYVSSGLASDAATAGADPNRKAAPIGGTTNQVKTKTTSARGLLDVNGALASAADDKGRQVKWGLLSSGTVLGGTSSKFYLNRAPGDRVHGTLGQMAVATGGSESFGASSGFWQIVREGFLRGDANGSGKVEFGDVIYLINYLFRFDTPPDPYEAGDVNCDGQVEFGDVIYLVNYLFRFGPEPSC